MIDVYSSTEAMERDRSCFIIRSIIHKRLQRDNVEGYDALREALDKIQSSKTTDEFLQEEIDDLKPLPGAENREN